MWSAAAGAPPAPQRQPAASPHTSTPTSSTVGVDPLVSQRSTQPVDFSPTALQSGSSFHLSQLSGVSGMSSMSSLMRTLQPQTTNIQGQDPDEDHITSDED